ncbi:MAG: hypothetical protein ACM31C_16375 [Acidobacteriota bacterium]
MTRALVAIVLACTSAHAAPKDAEAKRLFDRGVAAYTKGDLAAAAAALSESYAREGDPETLFAWAQAERKQGHCESAIELYNTLLAFELPAENKKVVEEQLGECKQIVAAKTKDTEGDRPKPAEPPKPVPDTPVAAQAEPPPPPPVSPGAEGRPWWRDPVGDGLVVGGAVGLGVGTALLLSARSADQTAQAAHSYPVYKTNEDTARDRGTYGVIGLVAGGALAAGGVWWLATHRDPHHAAVTGWVAPTSGGIAVSGAF